MLRNQSVRRINCRKLHMSNELEPTGSTPERVEFPRSNLQDRSVVMEKPTASIYHAAKMQESQNKLAATKSVARTVGMNIRKVAEEDNLLVGIVGAQPSTCHPSKKLLVDFKGNTRRHCRGTGTMIGTLKGFWLDQRQQTRFCWAVMMIIAFTILVPSEMDYFHLQRHRPTGDSGRLVR